MKEKVLEFYVSKFDYVEETSQADISFIPALMRRRLSCADKAAVSVMQKTFDENVQYIVFSSQYGEAERLFKLISQYSTEREVSPNIFSGSVHNYPVGFFLLNKKNPIPYNAVAACENSVSNGLLTALISKCNNILFCYADYINENGIAFAVNLHKDNKANSVKYKLNSEQNGSIKDNFSDYINLFTGKTNVLKTSLYGIERCNEND
jgi:hypothetical protein